MHTDAIPPATGDRDWKKAAVQQKIDASSVEIQEAISLLQGLREQQCQLKAELNAISSPILSLPTEVLTNIFYLACGMDTDIHNYMILPTPLLIGRICKAWRRTAWSTPRLWEIIAIRFYSTQSLAQEELLREWVQRSGNCPLQIFLTSEVFEGWSREEDEVSYYEPSESIIQFLFSTIKRWKTLDTYGFAHVRNFAHSLGKENRECSMPLLTSLRLYYTVYDIHDGARWDWRLGDTPNLRSLDITSLSYTDVRAPWSSLLNLTATLEIDSCLTLLGLCTSLKTCSLIPKFFGEDKVIFDPGQAPFSLPNLSSLTITGILDDSSRILRHITTPALKSLKFIFEKERDTGFSLLYDWKTLLLQFFERSSCMLEEFCLLGLPGSDDFVRDILEHTKTISRLSIRLIRPRPLSAILVSALTFSVTGEFLPILKELEYEGHISTHPDTLLAMMKSRLHPPKNLPNVQRIQKMHFTYTNASWPSSVVKNPNLLQKFYQDLGSLSSDDAVVKLVWSDLYDI